MSLMDDAYETVENSANNNDDESDDTWSASDFERSPITEGYHAISEDGHARSEVVADLMKQKGTYDDDKMTVGDALDGWNANEYDFDSLGEAAVDAMSKAVENGAFDEPNPHVGMLAVSRVVKSQWGSQHSNKVWDDGYKWGVGLRHPDDDNDLEQSEYAEGSYGDLVPDDSALQGFVEFDTPNGDVAATLEEERDVPIGSMGLGGGFPRLLAPNGEAIPLFLDGDTLEEAVETVASDVPRDLPGPSGYTHDGEADDAADDSDDSSTDDTEGDGMLDGVVIEDLSWNELRSKASDHPNVEYVNGDDTESLTRKLKEVQGTAGDVPRDDEADDTDDEGSDDDTEASSGNDTDDDEGDGSSELKVEKMKTARSLLENGDADNLAEAKEQVEALF